MTSATNRVVSLLFAALLSVALNILEATLAHSGTFTSFGPRLYERGTAAPASVVNSFAIPNPSTSYTLKIYNGGRTGIRTGERVSSAVITLNGAVIVSPQNFNEKISEISFPIKVLASNTLAVELRSKPGSLIVVEIVGVDNTPPSLTFTAPSGLIVMGGGAAPEVNVQYSDATSGVDLQSLQILVDNTNLTPLCKIGAASTSCPLPRLNGSAHTAYATISDRAGNVATASSAFEVNNMPIADAGQDINILTAGGTTLDGSGSYDPDGSYLTYQWLLVQAPLGSAAKLSNPSAPTPQFTPDVAGEYHFDLVVNDGLSNSLPDRAIVRAFAASTPPNARAGRDLNALVGIPTSLDGSGSFNSVPEALFFSWSFVSVPLGSALNDAAIAFRETARPQFTPDVQGTYVLNLRLTHLGLSDQDSLQVIASTPNVGPNAKAGLDRIIPFGSAVALDGSASADPDKGPSALSFSWSLIARPEGSNQTTDDLTGPNTATPSFAPDALGAYVFRLKVSDGEKSDEDNVLVNVFPNRPPVAVADTASTTENIPVNISVLTNDGDPDGHLPTVVSFTPASNGNVTFTNNIATYTPNTGFSGTDIFTYTISDGFGGTASATVTVTVNRANQAPLVDAGLVQPITLPANANLSGSVKDDGLPKPPGLVTMSWIKVSGPGTVTFGNSAAAATTASFSASGIYVLRLTANDGFLSASDDVQITVNPAGGEVLPADPSIVAPPIDPSVATNLANSTEFLYTGPNPIQIGVAPGTINPVRATVFRGKISDRSGAALSGVTISILNHPEFGETLSRSNGVFDMAVNGGGPLTINYQKTGFLPAQRQVNAPWQDFVIAPDVTLIPVDTQVTTIAANAAVMQIARGSVMSDSDGSRQATLLFPAGTTAAMIMPNGSTQPLTTLNVRATEYTVGPNGPKAMPAELPPTSGYTYAVELSADEALAAGAKRVTFNQPVIGYLENFLAFPVGTIVPSGFYDPDRAAWIPSDNGRVVKITGVTGGLASVDTVAMGGLAPVTLSTAERQQLALLYPVGRELWRVPIAHFTPWDCNWPFGPPPDARPPNLPKDPKRDPDDDCKEKGSIIQCLSQTLAETVPITGIPYHLRYDSDRVPGRRAAFTLNIPLSGSQLPASLRRIELEIFVAGRKFVQTFAAAPNQQFSFTWDGKDAYGREAGSTTAIVRIGYVYGAVYQQPAQLAQSFAAFGSAITGVRARQELTILQESRYLLSRFLSQVGGWSLSPNHTYDPAARVLIRGDGERRSAEVSDTVITTVAGNTGDGFSGDGGSATQAMLSSANSVAVAPDGSFYIADGRFNNRIRRVGPDGIITTVAGNGTFGNSGANGDGGPATQAGFFATAVEVAPDGGFYIADNANNRVRRVGPNGIITTVAGTGTAGFSGDGGPATQARLNNNIGIATAPDGSFYIADSGNFRIRRVGPDGIITTVAGNGTSGFSGDGGPAIQAQLNFFSRVATALDGSFYIADQTNHRIRRVGPDGIITTVAGNPSNPSGGFSGDGGLATQAELRDPTGIATAPDGSFYIADFGNNLIRLVRQDGIITTIAGTPSVSGLSGDNGPAARAHLIGPSGVALAPDGSLHIAESFARRVRRASSPLPGFSLSDIGIPSEDGSELYRFNANGRHLRTLNTLTGAVRHQFTYDSAGRLTGVTDGDGKITMIERDANGNPTAIVAPGGQRTTLAVNGNGYLSRIANPAGEAMQFSYTADGLLTTETDAKGNVHRFTYDALGRLIRDEDPAGGVKTLSRAETANGFQLTLTTALGRTSTYSIEQLATGAIQRVNSDRAGARTTVLSAPDGSVTITAPDGTRTTIQQGPDPRFGMLAPVLTSITHTSPAGRTLTQTTQRTATLSNPTNPLSLQTLTETVTINGRTFTSQYVAATRTTTTTTPEGRQSVAVIDAQGRVVSKRLAPNLSPITTTYDSLGRLTRAAQGEQALTYSYDSANRLVSRSDALGNRKTFVYDAADRPTQTTLPSGRTLRFANDANGNRTEVVMPSGSIHALDYTPINREASYTPPGNASYLRSDNVDRALSRSTLPGGRTVDVSYDSAGRDTGFNYTEAAIAFGYGTGDLTTRARRIVRTPSSVGSSQELTFTYDGDDVTGTTWAGAAQGQFNHTYDNNFLLTNTQFVSGTNNIQTAFVRDRDNLITTYGPFTLTRGGPAGAVSQISAGTYNTTFTYDALGRLTSRAQVFGSQQTFQGQFTYDVAGRIVRKVETVAGVAHTLDYSYDADGQLTQVVRDGAIAERYMYDTNGNRISHQLGNGPLEAATYDAQDRLSQHGTVAYQFNSDGFITARGGDTFLYSARGELLSATVAGQTATYSYDGIGRRVSQTASAGTTQYFYGSPANAFLLTAVRDAAGVLTMLFYDEAGLLIALERGGTRFYVATDQVGTPRLVTDSTGQVIKTLEIDSFGIIISDSNPAFVLPIGFAGGLADPVTGLVRFGLRDYDTGAGRWTARDPIRFAGGQANLFLYVNNDPVNRRDPLGLACFGFSAYFGIGGGIELCYDDGDFSVCGELGFGIGGSIDIAEGGVADNGESIVTELEAACGPVGAGVGASLSDKGCLKTKLIGSLKNFKSDDGNLKVSTDTAKALTAKCSLQAKLAGKVCGGTKKK